MNEVTTPGSLSVSFQTYLDMLDRRQLIVDGLHGGGLVDARVRDAYTVAYDQVSGRIAEYEQRPGLLDAAIAAGELAIKATKQLDDLRDILPGERLREYLNPYELTITRIGTFLIARGFEDDERARPIMNAASIGLPSVVAQEYTVATVQDSTEPEADVAETNADEPAIPSDSYEYQPVTDQELRLQRALAFIGGLEPDTPHELTPKELWPAVMAPNDTTDTLARHSYMRRLLADLASYVTSDGQPVFSTNARPGKAVRYTLRGGPDIALRQELEDNSEPYVTVHDSVTLAVFFKVFGAAMEAKGVPTMSEETLHALIDQDMPAQPASPAQDGAAIRRSRAESLQKLHALATDPALVERAIEELALNDPRLALIDYLQGLDQHMPDIQRFLDAFAGLQVALTFDKKLGGVHLNEVQKVAKTEDSIIGGTAPGSAAALAQVRAASAQERADMIAAKSAAALQAEVVRLAEVIKAQTGHTLRPDRPYSPTRWLSIFPEIGEHIKAGKNVFMVEVMGTLISAQNPELLTPFAASPEQSIMIIDTAIREAFTARQTQQSHR